MSEINWPLVHSRDDGIRPAGAPDECFYCGQKAGSPHLRACVVVKKKVEIKVYSRDNSLSGLFETNEPWSHDAKMIEFRYNESSWCMSNVTDREVRWQQPDASARLQELEKKSGGCLCGALVFRFVRVVDETPERDLFEEEN